jgi:hypothetical protein
MERTPSGGHQLRGEPSGGQTTCAGARSESLLAAHAGMAANDRTDACTAAAGKAPVRRRDAQTLPLPLPANGMEAARCLRATSQSPRLAQLGHTGSATHAGEHGTRGSLGVSMGGTSRAPFRPTGGTVLGSFLTAETAARAHDGWAAAMPGRALSGLVGSERGSARAPRQRAGLTTRPSAHAHGLSQQRNDADDDEPEQLTDSNGSDGDEGGGGATGIEQAGCVTALRKAPAAGVARGSKANCARYVGVSFVKCNAFKPFRASIHFISKHYTICYCPTAEAAARAYDAVACMIPGRTLNFPTTTPAAASSLWQRKGASTAPAESDILAAIAVLREIQPQPPPAGAVKYFGVSVDKTSACIQYRARIKIDGKQEYLGSHPTAEAAARAYCSARVRRGRAQDPRPQAQLPDWRQQRSGCLRRLSR